MKYTHKNKEMRSKLSAMLNEQAASIAKARNELKNAQRENAECYANQMKLNDLVFAYRHLHIAHSMMNGNTIDRIEAKNRPGNGPDWYEIGTLLKKYGKPGEEK